MVLPRIDYRTTFERAYYHQDNLFIKRSLRPSEFRTGYKGLHIPLLGKERLQNEAAALHFIRCVSNIPVPQVCVACEIDGSFILITEYVDVISMASLHEEQKGVMCSELKRHLDTLSKITSNRIGGPDRIEDWMVRFSSGEEYVFCHNDLSQNNAVAHPRSLAIRATVAWEYGSMPVFSRGYFERSFYERLGPSVAIKGRRDGFPLW
ncbi:hypothetical protein BDV23DRAFT_192175 [Aspergillus alliaceus]|uniref:Aminoglycoside phosphotransferase domain-containing protein n=1 Tax=Petromyces alliaceus TaxID=209559 RepID=A0A5N7CQ76_PETAA|nr:hypothetical protein BDV23DRAFT_192175 [Aspergillus alliaceus]